MKRMRCATSVLIISMVKTRYVLLAKSLRNLIITRIAKTVIKNTSKTKRKMKDQDLKTHHLKNQEHLKKIIRITIGHDLKINPPISKSRDQLLKSDLVLKTIPHTLATKKKRPKRQIHRHQKRLNSQIPQSQPNLTKIRHLSNSATNAVPS